jgi:hypothetical protein
MDCRLAEQAAAQAVGSKGHLALFDTHDAGDAVVFGEPLREHRETRLNQRSSRQVLGN